MLQVIAQTCYVCASLQHQADNEACGITCVTHEDGGIPALQLAGVSGDQPTPRLEFCGEMFVAFPAGSMRLRQQRTNIQVPLAFYALPVQ